MADSSLVLTSLRDLNSGSLIWRSASWPRSLFCTRGRCTHPARTMHLVGSLRRLRDALAPGSAVAAYRLSHLGNPYRTASFAMPSHFARKLARGQGRSRTLQRRFPASLFR